MNTLTALVYDDRATAASRCSALNNIRTVYEIGKGRYLVVERKDSYGPYWEVMWAVHVVR